MPSLEQPDWQETADKIGRLGDKLTGLKELLADPWAYDAIQGTAYEDQWRGTLEEYLAENRYSQLVIRRTVERLRSCPLGSKSPPPGLDLGRIGLGTYGWKYDVGLVNKALEGGIRLIDTAESYGFGRVEKALGEATLDGAIVASKVARNHMRQSSIMNAAYRSADKLGLKKLPLYQIHWPSPTVAPEEYWKAMNRLGNERKVENVGVCNFSVDMIERAINLSDFPIATVQVRLNVLDRKALDVLLPYCKARSIQVIAHSPLAQDFRLIKKAGYTAHSALSWIIKQGAVPIPHTNKLDHLEEILTLC